MEDFRSEVTQQLRQLKKQNNRINVEDILNEMGDLKKQIKNKDKYLDRGKNEEIYKLADSIKSISEEINNKLSHKKV